MWAKQLLAEAQPDLDTTALECVTDKHSVCVTLRAGEISEPVS